MTVDAVVVDVEVPAAQEVGRSFKENGCAWEVEVEEAVVVVVEEHESIMVIMCGDPLWLNRVDAIHGFNRPYDKVTRLPNVEEWR